MLRLPNRIDEDDIAAATMEVTNQWLHGSASV